MSKTSLWQAFYLRLQKCLEVHLPTFTNYAAGTPICLCISLISKDWTPYCTADQILSRKHHGSTDVWIKFSLIYSTGFIKAMLLCCMLYYVDGMTIVSCPNSFLDTFSHPSCSPLINYDSSCDEFTSLSFISSILFIASVSSGRSLLYASCKLLYLALFMTRKEVKV